MAQTTTHDLALRWPQGRWLQIVNWDKCQTYNKPNPPWGRLYTSLFTHPCWVGGSDATRSLIVNLWLYAMRTTVDGRLWGDPAFLQNVLPLNGPLDLEPLIGAVNAAGQPNPFVVYVNEASPPEKASAEPREASQADRSLPNRTPPTPSADPREAALAALLRSEPALSCRVAGERLGCSAATVCRLKKRIEVFHGAFHPSPMKQQMKHPMKQQNGDSRPETQESRKCFTDRGEGEGEGEREREAEPEREAQSKSKSTLENKRRKALRQPEAQPETGPPRRMERRASLFSTGSDPLPMGQCVPQGLFRRPLDLTDTVGVLRVVKANPEAWGWVRGVYLGLRISAPLESRRGRENCGSFGAAYLAVLASGLPEPVVREILAHDIREAVKLGAKRGNINKAKVWWHVHKQRLGAALERCRVP